MRPLRMKEVIKFSSLDDFSGQEMELIGIVIGDYKEVRKRFPEECGEAEEGFYLVRVGQRAGLFVVMIDEVLESFAIHEEVS